MNHKITIRDIAKKAGVSTATVSGILNNSGRQTPSTVNKVLKVIDEIGYVPRRNKLRAENTRLRGKIKELAFFHGRDSSNEVLDIITGIEDCLAEKNIKLRVIEIDNKLSEKQKLQDIRGGLIYGDVIDTEIINKYKFPCLSLSEHADHMAKIGYNYAECGIRSAEIVTKLNSSNVLIAHSQGADKLEHKITLLTFKEALDASSTPYTEVDLNEITKSKLKEYDFIFIFGDKETTSAFFNIAKDEQNLQIALIQSQKPNIVDTTSSTIHLINTCHQFLGATAAKLILQKISDKMDITGRILIEPPIMTLQV